jgi:hypothetical protein
VHSALSGGMSTVPKVCARSPMTSSAAWFVTYSLHEVLDKYKMYAYFQIRVVLSQSSLEAYRLRSDCSSF